MAMRLPNNVMMMDAVLLPLNIIHSLGPLSVVRFITEIASHHWRELVINFPLILDTCHVESCVLVEVDARILVASWYPWWLNYSHFLSFGLMMDNDSAHRVLLFVGITI